MRGAERRKAHQITALVRRGACLTIGTLASRRSTCGIFRLRSALLPAIRPGLQRAPRAGVLLPPGRVPKPPECPADEAERAGAAQADHFVRPGTARLISGRASRLLHQTSVTG